MTLQRCIQKSFFLDLLNFVKLRFFIWLQHGCRREILSFDSNFWWKKLASNSVVELSSKLNCRSWSNEEPQLKPHSKSQIRDPRDSMGFCSQNTIQSRVLLLLSHPPPKATIEIYSVKKQISNRFSSILTSKKVKI